jgi:cell fate regulator YaaT (PSP1 superfamily)
MSVFAEVRFKGTRKGYFRLELDPPASTPGDADSSDPSEALDATTLGIQSGDPVLVEVDRGEDLGILSAVGAIAERKCASSGGCGTPLPEHRILRRARVEEITLLESLRRDEDRVRIETRRKVEELGLRMKVTEAEWQFDRRKLTIYFTAERRVDFRELVRDLARQFRTRIELRQIGIRDESALLGGVGRCGRELCSSTWLPELKPVSLHLAKEQNLSLNPSQISGGCGRLMCCLQYEHETYVQARRRFPREGKTLRTALGEERVASVDIWADRVTLRGPDGARRTVALEALKEEVQSASRNRPEDTPT